MSRLDKEVWTGSPENITKYVYDWWNGRKTIDNPA